MKELAVVVTAFAPLALVAVLAIWATIRSARRRPLRKPSKGRKFQ
jgi:hypothetical protein